MNGGALAVVGLGPGSADLVAPRADAVLAAATDIVGYAAYVARVPERPGQTRHESDNREEPARARLALALAAAGRRVAVVSSGDAGVFAMASAVFEAIEHGEPEWRRIEVEVVPGISAMFAAAARVGAPLGHDFCVLSLSDNLKPWDVVLRRATAAAEAGFVLALYNVASRARPWQLATLLRALGPVLPPETPVVFATAVSRPDERIEVTSLAASPDVAADMRTLVIVGSAATRVVAREAAPPFVYAPRRSLA